MEVDEVRTLRWRYAGGGVLLAVFGWFAFVLGTRVPLLGWVDLFVHEAGHVLAAPLPDLGEAVMGSGFQVLVPLVLAAGFLWQQRDWLGAVVCVGWASTSLQDASVYIADAPFLDLPLIGGIHDWNAILLALDRLWMAEGLARAVWALGLVLWTAAVAGCLVGPRVDALVRAGRWPRWPLLPLPTPVVVPPPSWPDVTPAAHAPDAPPDAGGEVPPDGGFFTTPPQRG